MGTAPLRRLDVKVFNLENQQENLFVWQDLDVIVGMVSQTWMYCGGAKFGDLSTLRICIPVNGLLNVKNASSICGTLNIFLKRKPDLSRNNVQTVFFYQPVSGGFPPLVSHDEILSSQVAKYLQGFADSGTSFGHITWKQMSAEDPRYDEETGRNGWGN